MGIPTVLTQPLESAVSPAKLQPPPDLLESSPEDYFFQRILQSALQHLQRILQCLQRTSSQSLNWNPRVLSLWPKPLFFFPSFPAPFTLLDQWDPPAPCFVYLSVFVFCVILMVRFRVGGEGEPNYAPPSLAL